VPGQDGPQVFAGARVQQQPVSVCKFDFELCYISCTRKSAQVYAAPQHADGSRRRVSFVVEGHGACDATFPDRHVLTPRHRQANPKP
jgi:hypothetical protein